MEITLLDEIYARAWEEGKLNICLKVWSLKKKHGLFSNKFALDNPAVVEDLLEQVTEVLNRLEETSPDESPSMEEDDLPLQDQVDAPPLPASRNHKAHHISALPFTKAALKDRDRTAREEDQEENKIPSIPSLLPPEVSQDELGPVIHRAIEKTEARGPQDIGAVMTFLKHELPGHINMIDVYPHVKHILAHKT